MSMSPSAPPPPSRANAATAGRSLTHALAAVAHELNSELALVVGYAQMLVDDSRFQDNEVHSQLNEIVAAGRRASERAAQLHALPAQCGFVSRISGHPDVLETMEQANVAVLAPTTQAAHVLVVEDDTMTATLLSQSLQHVGYQVTVVGTASTAARAMESAAFDAVLLDLGLPDSDGFQLLDLWHGRYSTPIVVLSATSDVAARLQAFQRGAEDFLVKPVHLPEMHARLKARIRHGSPVSGRRVAWADVLLDLDGRRAWVAGGACPLTPHEFNVLAWLVEHAGQIISRSELAARALPVDGDRTERTVDSHIAHLRAKLGPVGAAHVMTVRGQGYRFEAQLGRRSARTP